MTKFNPSERIQLEDIFKHPWVMDDDLPDHMQFKEEMKLRCQQVSEHYRKLAHSHISKIKNGKPHFLEDEDAHWEIPEALEDWVPEIMNLIMVAHHHTTKRDLRQFRGL